jgi:hypothetical protein
VSDLTWRPSMFAPVVVHLTREGDPAYTSERYPGQRFVHAACGQDTNADDVRGLESIECPECLVWLRNNS